MSLNVKAFALAAGVLWGLGMFLVTLATLWRGGGHDLNLLAGIYFGYRVRCLGSIIGLAYGFVNDQLGGAVFAWLYYQLVRGG